MNVTLHVNIKKIIMRHVTLTYTSHPPYITLHDVLPTPSPKLRCKINEGPLLSLSAASTQHSRRGENHSVWTVTYSAMILDPATFPLRSRFSR